MIWGSVLRRSGAAGAAAAASWLEPIRWFGRHSYEVYLSHEFAVIAVFRLFVVVHRGPIVAWIGAVLASSALLGWIFARYLSEPLNRALRGQSAPAYSPTEIDRGEPAVADACN